MDTQKLVSRLRERRDNLVCKDKKLHAIEIEEYRQAAEQLEIMRSTLMVIKSRAGEMGSFIGETLVRMDRDEIESRDHG